MSAENQSGAGRREVAYRLFAAEFDDADLEYSEDDDERAPNYVITPTGARVNRLFIVGVLTEVEPVNEDMLRARIVDPTGAFVSYAGQYQPDAQSFLERADPPQFVAVTGKARTFEPDDGNVIYTSVRPETINAVDAETRDRWTVQTARHTIDRIRTMAGALERAERGDELETLLERAGVESGFAAGIPLAIDHYKPTTGYLAALRTLCVHAAEVVAGDRDEVESVTIAPDEGGDAPIPDAMTFEEDPISEPASEEAASEDVGTAADASVSGGTETPSAGDEEAAETDAGDDRRGDEEGHTDEEPAAGDAEDVVSERAEANGEELYELDEAERQAVEDEYGTEFSTGTEVEEPDDTGADAESPHVEDDETDVSPQQEPVEAAAGTDEPGEPDDSTEESDAAVDSDDASATEEPVQDDAEPAEAVDLEEVAVETMAELDDGDGADRNDVVETVASEYGVDEADVEAAIEDALMSGMCYEPGDDRLKAI